MEHVIQEHILEYPEAYKGEVVLHCMDCDDWVSTKDNAEVIAEFKDAPCSGPSQHDDDEILPTTSGHANKKIGRKCPCCKQQTVSDPCGHCNRLISEGDRT